MRNIFIILLIGIFLISIFFFFNFFNLRSELLGIISLPSIMSYADKEAIETPSSVSNVKTYNLDFSRNLNIQRTNIKNGFQLDYEDISCQIVLNEPNNITYSNYKDGIEWTNKLSIPTKTVLLTTSADLTKEIYYNLSCNQDIIKDKDKILIKKGDYNFEIDFSTLNNEFSSFIYNEKDFKVISYIIKPQAYDLTYVIGNKSARVNIKIQDKYITEKDILKQFTISDYLYLDPTYSISNITLGAVLNNIQCEGGGYSCHLGINDPSLVLYMPFDVENNSATVYDWSDNNNDGTLSYVTVSSIADGVDTNSTQCVDDDTLSNLGNDIYNGWTFRATSGVASGNEVTISDYAYVNSTYRIVYFATELTGFSQGDNYYIYYNDKGPVWNSTGGINSTGAYQFDGGDDYITPTFINLGSVAGEQKNYSMSAWVKTNTTGGSIIAFKKSNGDNPMIIMDIQSNGEARFYYKTDDATLISTDSNTVVSDNEWHHILGMRNESGANIYVDGVFKAGTSTDTNKSITLNLVNIGVFQMSNARYNSFFNGTIDEVMIFNRSLSANEILQIYNQQFPRFYPTGNHTLNQTITSGENRVNISIKNSNQPNTNLSLRIWDGTSFTGYQNMSNNVPMEFNISTSATNLNLSFLYLSDTYNFGSPILLNNIILGTWNVTGGEAPPEDNEYPIFNFYNTSIVNNSQYISGASYNFNVTITSTNGTTGLDFNNANYSLSNITSMFNKTLAGLSAGTYSYYYWSFGNGTSKNYNVSKILDYTIAKNISAITPLLNGNNANLSIVYPQQVNASFTGTNYTNAVIKINSTTVIKSANYTWGAGGWIVNYSLIGNTNYSAYETSLNLEVNKSGNNFTRYLNSGTSNISILYPQQINATILGNYTTATIKINNTIVTSGANYTWGGGGWLVNYSVISNQNYTANETYLSFSINKSGNSLNVLLNNIANNLTVTYPQPVNVSVSGNKTQAIILLNLTTLTNSINYTIGGGVWFVNVSSPFNQNYTSNESHWYITINKTSSLSYAYINNSRANFTATNNSAQNILLNGSFTGTGNGNLILNGSIINSGASPLSNLTNLSNGYYNFTSYYSGNQNYTLSQETWWINVTEYISLPDLYPVFSNYKTDISNASIYLLGRNYGFNATIVNTNGTCGLDFNNINNTLNNLSSSFNSSIGDLGVGDYSYYYWCYGNGASHHYNISNIQYYTIVKSTSIVYAYVDNKRQNYNANNNTAQNIYLNGTLIAGIGDISLYLNGSLINSGATPLYNRTNLSIGVYYFNVTNDGNDNWTSATEKWKITITAYTPPITGGNVTMCRYKKFGYYNIKLPFFRETNCV